MGLRPLLRKELLWSRRNLAVVLLVTILVPAAVGASTLAFERSVPRDVPVAVVPASDDVTEDEREAVTGLVVGFGTPHEYQSEAAARTAMQRERVVAALSVPHGLYDEDANVTMTLTVDATMVPYERPSSIVARLLRERVSTFPAAVTVERATVGGHRSLSEYLFATAPVLLAVVYALAYVPHHVAREERVLDRLRVESSLPAVLASKGVLFFGLLAVALGALSLVGRLAGYRADPLAPGTVGVALLTFGYLSAVALGVMFLTDFGATGRYVNAGLLLGVLAFSSLVFPRGTFSSFRGTVADANPVYHSAVVGRSVAMEGLPVALFARRLALLAAVAVLTIAWLRWTMNRYERRA